MNCPICFSADTHYINGIPPYYTCGECGEVWYVEDGNGPMQHG